MYLHNSLFKFIKIFTFILIFILSGTAAAAAAAEVGVEDEQRFNFGCAAIWPQTATAATKKS